MKKLSRVDFPVVNFVIKNAAIIIVIIVTPNYLFYIFIARMMNTVLTRPNIAFDRDGKGMVRIWPAGWQTTNTIMGMVLVIGHWSLIKTREGASRRKNLNLAK